LIVNKDANDWDSVSFNGGAKLAIKIMTAIKFRHHTGIAPGELV